MSFWVAGAAVVGTVGGALIQKKGAKGAAAAQGRAADASIGEQQRQYDLAREDQAPYRQIGGDALNQLASLYGLRQFIPGYGEGDPNQGPIDPNTGQPMGAEVTPGAPGQPNYNAFFNSPDYQFTRDQGQQVVERSASARGGLFSGNTGAALQQYGQGLASTQIGNYTNRLASLAGIGQSSVQNTGQLGFNTGQGISDSLISGGNARASGIIGSNNAYADALGSLGGVAADYFGSRRGNQLDYVTPTVRRIGP